MNILKALELYTLNEVNCTACEFYLNKAFINNSSSSLRWPGPTSLCGTLSCPVSLSLAGARTYVQPSGGGAEGGALDTPAPPPSLTPFIPKPRRSCRHHTQKPQSTRRNVKDRSGTARLRLGAACSVGHGYEKAFGNVHHRAARRPAC